MDKINKHHGIMTLKLLLRKSNMRHLNALYNIKAGSQNLQVQITLHDMNQDAIA
jgi:hypothetical protein